MFKRLKINKHYIQYRYFGTKLISKPPEITKLHINGEFIESKSNKYYDVKNPSTQDIITKVPEILDDEFNLAVSNTLSVQKEWCKVPVSERQRYFFKYQSLIKEYQDDIAEMITLEHGKIKKEALGDVFRGLEIVEYSCNISSQLLGDTLNNVASNVDLISYKEPLGVTAGICPFNFPAMIPLWMFPLSIACGNGFILKPSERTPSATHILTELFYEAGFPKGILNIVHGGINCVNNICDHPDIKSISFVGSNNAGEYIHQRGTSNNKRVQCNMGAKNHGTILPDANKIPTLLKCVDAAFGSTGMRCMALPVLNFVGKSQEWIPELVNLAEQLIPGDGNDNSSHLGPAQNTDLYNKIIKYIDSAIDDGGEILLDGRNYKNNKYPKGNFIGPTIITNINSNMKCYKEEIFGPVLLINKCDTLDDAIKFTNNNPYGNGTAIFSTSHGNITKYSKEIEAGQVGVNIPIPVPLPFFSFTGNKASFRGGNNFYGKRGVDFYTNLKTIVSNSQIWEQKLNDWDLYSGQTKPIQSKQKDLNEHHDVRLKQ